MSSIEKQILFDKEIQDCFVDLLMGKINDFEGTPITKYKERIESLKKIIFSGEPYCRSVIIDYDDLQELDDHVHLKYPVKKKNKFSIAETIRENPSDAIKELNQHLHIAIEKLHPRSKSKGEISELGPFYIRVKLPKMDIEGMEFVSGPNTERFISIKGIVTTTYEKRPLLVEGQYECRTCGKKMPLRQPYYTRITPPPVCNNYGNCASADEQKKSMVLIERESVFVSSQIIEVQEEPNHLKKRNTPSSIRVLIIDDGVYGVQGGDLVTVTGTLKVVPDHNLYKESFKSPTFDQFILASAIDVDKKDIFGDKALYTEQDFLNKVSSKKKQEEWWNRMCGIIAHGIKGYKYVKEGLCCLLFSGQERWSAGGDVKRRGYINILIGGDPGTGKTAIAKSLRKLVPKAIFTNAKQSSEAGLTAGITFDDHRKPILNAGALVKADGGFAIIDELDKAKKQNLYALLQALEEQQVTIAKISTLQTLQSRCDVLCLANPNGRYKFDKEFIDNFNTIPVPLLSRFDLVFLLVDIDPRKNVADQEKKDDDVTNHILELDESQINPSKKKTVPQYVPTEEDYEFMSEYIKFAKLKAEKTPITLSLDAKIYLRNFYKDKRKRAYQALSEGEMNPEKPLDARYLEGLIRLTTSRAKALLKSVADEDDAKVATTLLMESLKQISPNGEADVSIMSTGKSSVSERHTTLVLECIGDLLKKDEYKHGIPITEFENEVKKKGIVKKYKDANKRIKMNTKKVIDKIMSEIKEFIQYKADGSFTLNQSGYRNIRKSKYITPKDGDTEDLLSEF